MFDPDKAAEVEWELKMDVMRADIASRTADTGLRGEQRRWEPWKALSTAFGAGFAVATGLFALATWVVSHVR